MENCLGKLWLWQKLPLASAEDEASVKVLNIWHAKAKASAHP